MLQTHIHTKGPRMTCKGRGGGGALPDFFFFPCSAAHERDWPPCKVVFFGLATNALNVRNNNNSTKSFCCSSEVFQMYNILLVEVE